MIVYAVYVNFPKVHRGDAENAEQELFIRIDSDLGELCASVVKSLVLFGTTTITESPCLI